MPYAGAMPTDLERTQGEWLLLERRAPNQRRRVLFLPCLFGGRWTFFGVIDRPALAEAGVSPVSATPPGFAGNPVSGHDLSVRGYAEAVVRLARTERIDAIVGYSYFANVAIEIAASRQFNGALMLVSPSLRRACETRSLRVFDRLTRLPFAGMQLVPGTLDGFSKSVEHYQPFERSRRAAAEIRANEPRAALRVVHGFFDHMREMRDLTDALLAAKNPIVYLRGDRDEIQLPHASRRAIEFAENIQLVTVPGAKHDIVFTHGDAVARAVIGMVRR
jgi:pimeloyl-ACP methyl ester carboxylesterase